MKYLFFSFFILLSATSILAQNKNDFSIEFNINGSHHNMGSINDFTSKSLSYEFANTKYEKNYFNTLDVGLDYNLGINYQPMKFLDFGIYANYQSSNMKRTFFNEENFDPINYPDSIIARNGKINSKTSAFTVGLSSNLYINKLVNFHQIDSRFFQKLIVSVGLKGGLGMSAFSEKASLDNYFYDYSNIKYNATNVNGRAELAIGYPLFNKSFFSSVGFKVGYQYFKTSPVRNYADNYLYANDDPNKKISLNFSGIYYGIYLKIGK